MKPRLTHLAVIGVLAAAFAVTGCGRKGPLDPPPSAESSDASSKAAKPKSSSPGASLNPLQRNEQRTAAPAFDADGKPLASANAPKKSLPMDWLLD